MRSAFFGFHVASSALFMSRANVNVASHNISNAELPGFSRQVVRAQAATPLHLNDGRGMYGTGSQMTAVEQVRNRFLDQKFWGQRSTQGQFVAKNTHLTFVETVFNNLGNVGVLRAFNDFFTGLQELSVNAPDSTFRTNIITGAQTLSELVQHNANTLRRQQTDLNGEVADTVALINSLGSQISTLNDQINIAERDGSRANDLRDQRALLLDELSKHVNIEVEERDHSRPGINYDRRTYVRINGYDFVNHTRFNRLELVPRQAGERRNEMDIDGLYDIRFGGTNSPFNIYSTTLRGTLRGLIDIRDGNHTHITENEVPRWPRMFDPWNPQDWPGGWPAGLGPNDFESIDPTTWPIGTTPGPGNTTNFKGIPFYMNQLNHLVRTFARAMNEGRNVQGDLMPGVTGHIHGYDGNHQSRQTMFFTFADDNGDVQTTANLRRWVLADLVADPTGRTPQRDAQGNFVTVDTPNPPVGAAAYSDADGNPIFILDMSELNALNFIVNPDLVRDSALLATSTSRVQGESNNDVIHGFGLVGNDRSLFREGRLIDFIIATSSHLAVDKQQANNFEISYSEITLQTHNHRLSIKGVDLNEEMMNLVRFQQMFTAASRLVNVLDSIYDTLINRLGNM